MSTNYFFPFKALFLGCLRYVDMNHAIDWAQSKARLKGSPTFASHFSTWKDTMHDVREKKRLRSTWLHWRDSCMSPHHCSVPTFSPIWFSWDAPTRRNIRHKAAAATLPTVAPLARDDFFRSTYRSAADVLRTWSSKIEWRGRRVRKVSKPRPFYIKHSTIFELLNSRRWEIRLFSSFRFFALWNSTFSKFQTCWVQQFDELRTSEQKFDSVRIKFTPIGSRQQI